jgi:hypothetical protein
LGLRAKEIASLTIADVANSNYHLLNEISLKRCTPTLSHVEDNPERLKRIANPAYCNITSLL